MRRRIFCRHERALIGVDALRMIPEIPVHRGRGSWPGAGTRHASRLNISSARVDIDASGLMKQHGTMDRFKS